MTDKPATLRFKLRLYREGEVVPSSNDENRFTTLGTNKCYGLTTFPRAHNYVPIEQIASAMLELEKRASAGETNLEVEYDIKSEAGE
jgi:hypothetical protein